MTDASLPARFAEGDFRVGRVLNRTASVLSRNFLPFFVVTTIAQLPAQLLSQALTSITAAPSPSVGAGVILIGAGVWLLTIVLGTLSQAIVLYGAFQDMRGRPVSLVESLQVGLRRFFPIIGLSICISLLGGLAALALIFPAFILFTMWFVATPACVVEQLGPIRSMGRSRQLTKGHRWKTFGLMLSLFIVLGLVSGVLGTTLVAVGGTALALVGAVLWSGVWGAFYAISVVVTYHDLRVAKEGTDIEQIAAVFD
jgi:MFS family permease